MRHAARGVVTLLSTQINARIHTVAALVVIALGCWLDVSWNEWGLLILAIGLVLCAEALNTAIELVVDLASPNWHELARDAKDVAAGAVLLSSVAAFAVGLTVFLPRLLEKL
jgi:diacylglycerol kinase